MTSPWVLWALSLSVAIIMWFYGLGSEDDPFATRKFSCAIEYRNLEPQAILRNPVQEAEVEVKGRESVLKNIDYDSVVCFVDIKNRLPGKKYTEEVRVTLPPDVTLVNRYPSQVIVEPIIQVGRFFKVELKLPSDMPEGQYLEGVSLIPGEVTIKGSEKDLSKIGELHVKPTVAELQAGKELLLPVAYSQSEPFEDEVLVEPTQVKVIASLVRGFPKRRIPVNVRLTGSPNPDYEVKSVITDPAEVMVEGPQLQLDKLSMVDTETVDITAVSEDQIIVVPLRPLELQDVSLPNVKSVRLTVALEPVRAQKQFVNVPLQVRGGEESHWSLTPAVVNVTLENLPSRIGEVRMEAIGLACYVDVSNIYLDATVLPVRAEVASQDFTVVKIDPPTVAVNAVEEAVGW
ncbi:MAG: hypothetical protein GX256_06850 [Fretibacterium sp.]|nr:hypothetical protein [Fretibacterium sp.]